MAVITISRQFGSGGEAIGRGVAEKLGYDYVDKELIVAVAQEAHTEESEVSRFDERGRHPVTHFLKKYLIGEHHVIPAWPTYYWYDELDLLSVREGRASISSTSCRKLFESTIKKLWERGNGVIVGRGAEIILARRPGVLSVRIIAPLAYRVQRVMQEEDLTQDHATKRIHHIDKGRARYIKQNYGFDWGRPEHFQLILDTKKISEEIATQIICQALSRFDEA